MQVNKEILKNYILNLISDDEQEELADKLFLDDELFEMLRQTEDDLIKSYVRKELSTIEMLQFEDIFFSSEKLSQKVEQAKLQIETDTPAKAAAKTATASVGIADEKESWWSKWLSVFQNPLIPASSALVLVITVGGALWFIRSNGVGLVSSNEIPVIAENTSQTQDTVSSSQTQDEFSPSSKPKPPDITNNPFAKNAPMPVSQQKPPIIRGTQKRNDKAVITDSENLFEATNPPPGNQNFGETIAQEVDSQEITENTPESDIKYLKTKDLPGAENTSSSKSPGTDEEIDIKLKHPLPKYLGMDFPYAGEIILTNKKVVAAVRKFKDSKVRIRTICKVNVSDNEGQKLTAIFPTENLKKGKYEVEYYVNNIRKGNSLGKNVLTFSIP